MAKATKKVGKKAGKVLHGWWAWKDPSGDLDLENLRPTRVRCDARSNPWGDRHERRMNDLEYERAQQTEVDRGK